MAGPRKAAATQAHGIDAKRHTIFLDHDIGCELRRAEERVLGGVDPQILADTVEILVTYIVPARWQLNERQLVWRSTIDFVGGHMDEDHSGDMAAGSFQEVQRTSGIDVEVIKGDCSRQVVRRLGGRVDDHSRLYRLDQLQNARAI